MKKLQKIHKSIVLGLFIMLLVISSVFASQGGSTTDITRTIDVSGNAQIEVAPDQAIIYITVNSKGRNSEKVQEENTIDMDAIISSLTRMGISNEDIETSRYTIQPNREYHSISGKYITKGYIVHHTIKVTVENLDSVGEILALAIENGATNIDNVQFSLSKEAEEQALIDLYSLAAQNGEAKAIAIGKGLSLDVGKAMYVSEMNYQPIYWEDNRYALSDFEDSVEVASLAPTINPQEQRLDVTLQMTFAFV